MKKLIRICLPLLLAIALLCAASCGLDPRSLQRQPVQSTDDLPAYSGEAYAAINGNTPYFTDAEKTAARQSYETYAELDALGRCGVCVASVGKDLMPTEPRGSISSVKPTGWPAKVEDAKYDFVDGKYLYNRCHLIGFQLTGENANRQNLITGTRYLNVTGMLPFENMVADYVKETGNHVLYRVTPVFGGNNLVAFGVLMEAWSVEDGGDGVCFCVFCYNVQPGVVIDYINGNSRLANAGEELMPDWGGIPAAQTPSGDDPATGTGETPQANAPTLLAGSEDVRQGDTATVRIQGTPGVAYSVRVKLPSGSYSGAAALKDPKTAGTDGVVEWSWTIQPNTRPGTATVTVTGGEEILEFTFAILEKPAE